MDLLERSSALGELGGLLAATATGGRVVLVAGEAGIGKSALVRQFTERQSADAWFLLGACDPLLTPRALGPLYDIARQTGGRLAELLAAGGPREAIFAAFLDELDQGGRPRVVVVEDAHWADEATLDLLVFLGRRLERTRALLLVTYRDDEVAADHPLRAAVGRLAPEAVRHLRLEPLSEAAVAELARRAGRPVAGLRTLTGGNPLLVTEVLSPSNSQAYTKTGFESLFGFRMARLYLNWAAGPRIASGRSPFRRRVDRYLRPCRPVAFFESASYASIR